MGKKILIIGGVAGGASAAARIRRLDETAKIIIFEKGPHVSFSNCSLPYRLSDTVNKTEDLILMSPEKFLKQYNIEARVNSEVVKIQRNEKKILVRDHASGREYEESYDKLILSPGARPILPRSIEGIDKEHVFTARSVTDIDRLYTYLKKNNIEDVAVVGGGYIGLEIADNLHLAGKKVSIIEASEQVMAPFDNDMAQILHKEIYDKGVNLILNDAVVKIDSDHLVLESGRKVNAKAVVVAVGVAPDTALAKDAGLEIGATGAIKVDHNYLTSDKDIYAIGDAIEVYSRLEHRYFTCGLAGPAQRQARAAADHIYGIPYRNNGHICTSIVKLFDLNAASTGLNEKRAKATGISYDFVYIIPFDKVSLMPDSNIMHFKLIYEYPNGENTGCPGYRKGKRRQKD
ncbi:FAD-dependent oxidoreductase [Acetomicrobium sp.]|uniref:FAD-dependent oxidoreductase n=1 Tax=Acetomicrobium sp. TaxID=1872099 RepID=UPI002870BCEF|nr:FAD-dependent oxidoreductase [Acetomicrobium sp.]MDR9769404.1 FAD-dependent oxidoreductase [Acetomicrobium sp.]